MCHLLANMQNIPSFGPNATPVVYGTLPGGHRFAGGLGGNIQYGKPDEGTVKGSICLCIRQFVREQKIELEHYGAERGKALRVSTPSIFTKQNDPDDPHAKIYNSLVRGDHILVSGPTGCGKTSFINRLIANISPHKRIVTVEDTRELIVPAPNRVHIVMSRTDQGNKFTYLDVRDLIVRMTPDIVLAGELSTTNAAVIWNLMTTGHGSFMTTIHAESVREAVGSFIRLVVISSASNAQIDQRALAEEMLSKLRIIQLKHDDVLGRHIEAIH
jgi:type IV secretory pathway ATPase VirB11/archaellum biosynthesis ATPase